MEIHPIPPSQKPILEALETILNKVNEMRSAVKTIDDRTQKMESILSQIQTNMS